MIALVAVLVVGCTAAGVPARGTTVNSTLTDEMTMTGYGGTTGMMGNAGRGLISVDRSSVPSGQVTFVVKNGGLLVHEFVVLQTEVAHDKIRAASSEPGKVDETGSVGETGALNAGESKTLTLTLAAGHYVLMCNEVGHYEGGMHLAFTVN